MDEFEDYSHINGLNETPQHFKSNDSQKDEQHPKVPQTEEERTYIWGTNFDVKKCFEKISSFMYTFRPSKGDDSHIEKKNKHIESASSTINEDGSEMRLDGDQNSFDQKGEFARNQEQENEEGYYVGLIRHSILIESGELNIDGDHIATFDFELYKKVLNFPQELIPMLDLKVNEILLQIKQEIKEKNRSQGEEEEEEGEEEEDYERLQVRIFNLRNIKSMRDLNPSDIDQLIAIHGMITRVSSVIPDLRQGFFKCTVCSGSATVMIDRGRIEEPKVCPHCNKINTMSLIHNRCFFADKQLIKLQETPDCIPEGETPHTVSLCVFDTLVDIGVPGDRVEVTGIFRSAPVRLSQNKRALKSIYRTYIDVLHLKKTSRASLHLKSLTTNNNNFEKISYYSLNFLILVQLHTPSSSIHRSSSSYHHHNHHPPTIIVHNK